MRASKTTFRAILLVGLTLILASCTTLETARDIVMQRPAPVFQARDGEIYTPEGKLFVARGVNLQYGDHP